MDYSLLNCQAGFCQSKNRLDWALECAKRSVTAAPSEFGTWAKLAEIYVGLEQWDLALLTLNSCPMFTYQDKDAPRMPEPSRVLLPVLPETLLDELDDPPSYDNEMVHPSLRKLHAAGYKGTFLKAYSLLTEITSKIGWDQLLKIRSQVFVMEEEYRSEKQTGAPQQTSQSKNASTTALRSQSPNPATNGSHSNHDDDETLNDRDHDGASTADTTVAGSSLNGGPNHATEDPDDSIERPEHTITTEEAKAGNDDVSILLPYDCLQRAHLCSPTPPTQLTPTSTTNASASAGSTTSSWSSTKTSASTPSGAPTWRAPQPTPPHRRQTPTINPPKSGRF